jgi:hypothetical protein
VNGYAYFPLMFSSTSSINGVGNGSCRYASFSFLKLTHIRIPPVFLSYTTMGLIHFDSSTGLITPAFSIQSISSFTFSLYLGFIL